MKDKYGLNNDFFRYLQLRDYTEELLKKIILDELESEIVKSLFKTSGRVLRKPNSSAA